MSTVTRWDPIREMTTLHDAVSQLFEHAVLRPGWSAVNTGSMGQMNVAEAQDHYYCHILLPGIAPDQIELMVRQNTLSVKATQPESFPEELRKSATYLLREFAPGEYSRTITFPKDVNADAVEARYNNGILTVVIPLAKHAQPKKIQVQAVDGGSKGQLIEAGANERETTNTH